MTLVDTETGEVVGHVLVVGAAAADYYNFQVHPAADRYPMMPADALLDLAEDIMENGQREAISIDADGFLVDGRNRLEACRLVDIAPRFEVVDVRDVEAFIASKNLHRRHLTVRQQRDIRKAKVAELRAQGMSTRQIADEVGVSESQVRNDCAPDSPQPEKVVGKDGKSYPAKRNQWTKESATDFVRRYEAGERETLMTEFGITRLDNAVRDLRKRYGIAHGPQARTPANAQAKRERIAELAPSGMTAAQIAAEVGLTEGTVRHYVAEMGVTIHAEKVMGRTRRLDASRVIGGIVERVSFDIENDSALAAVSVADANRDLLEQWVSSLTESINSLIALRKRIKKELTRE